MRLEINIGFHTRSYMNAARDGVLSCDSLLRMILSETRRYTPDYDEALSKVKRAARVYKAINQIWAKFAARREFPFLVIVSFEFENAADLAATVEALEEGLKLLRDCEIEGDYQVRKIRAVEFVIMLLKSDIKTGGPIVKCSGCRDALHCAASDSDPEACGGPFKS